MTVERVEANPESERVGPRHDRPQPLLVRGRPWTGVVLTAFFDHRPPEVRPSPIVGRTARDQGLWGGADGHLRALLGGLRRGKTCGGNRAEESQSAAGRHAGVKRVDLMLAGLGDHQQGSWHERRHGAVIGGARSGRQPGLVPAEQLPDRLMMGRLVGLEIEVQDHHRPGVAAVLLQRALHERPHAIEEMRFERRFGAIRLGIVRDDRAAAAGGRIDEPGDVLLDGQARRPHRERALDPIAPTTLFRVAVMGVQPHLCAGLEAVGRGG